MYAFHIALCTVGNGRSILSFHFFSWFAAAMLSADGPGDTTSGWAIFWRIYAVCSTLGIASPLPASFSFRSFKGRLKRLSAQVVRKGRLAAHSILMCPHRIRTLCICAAVLCCRCRALVSFPCSLWKQCDAQREDSWVMMQMARGDRQLFLSDVLRNACRS